LHFLSSARKVHHLKLVFLLPGNQSDFGYNYQIEQSIQELRASMPTITIAYVNNVAVPNCTTVAINFLSQGFDLLFFPNAPFLACAQTIALSYPTKQFVIQNGTFFNRTLPNLASYQTAGIDDAHFIASVLSAKQKHTHKICLMMPKPYPFQRRVANRVLLGIRYANSNDELHVGLTAGFNDPTTETIVANHFIAYGCDVVMLHAINSIHPLEITADADLWSIGVSSDMRNFVGNSVLTSVVLNWVIVYEHYAELALQGPVTNEHFVLNLQNGGVDLADYSPQTTKKARKAANKAKRKIISGKVNTLCQPLIEEIFNKPCATVDETNVFYFPGITVYDGNVN